MVRTVFTLLGFSLVILVIALAGQGCATIVPPQGGFKDTLPPALIDLRPADSSLNSSERRIVFSFDEYVDLDQSAQAGLLISPLPQRPPQISRKLNVVIVKLGDSLTENTTYSIDFGKTIKDINEGNILNNFRYIFSTGPYIDSLEIRGRVLLAETGQVDTNMLVVLHSVASDSAIIVKTPRFAARLDGGGNFVFHNLPPETFYMYAVSNKSNYRYNRNELFAFADSSVTSATTATPVTLYAYKPILPETKTRTVAPVTTGRPNAADKRLRFQTNIVEEKQDLLQSFVMTFDNPLKDFDSAKAVLTYDTAFTTVQDYHWTLDSTRKKATLTYAWQPSVQYHLILDKEFANDSLGHQLLKTDTVNFKARAKEEYGALSIRFRNLDLSKNPVILLYQSDALKVSYPLTDIIFSQGMMLPGEYEIRVLDDTNKNGKWDAGEFFVKHLQPELVRTVQKKITVRANITNEYEVDLATTTAPKLPGQDQQQPPPQNGRRF